MHIHVENQYESTGNSHINVHCRRFLDTDFTTINPTQKELFEFTDKVVLYVEEIHENAPNRGKKRFDYINVGMGINTETEWRNENTLVGGVMAIGTYDPNPDKCETVVQIIMVGPTSESKKPTTVNVQVGGN